MFVTELNFKNQSIIFITSKYLYPENKYVWNSFILPSKNLYCHECFPTRPPPFHQMSEMFFKKQSWIIYLKFDFHLFCNHAHIRRDKFLQASFSDNSFIMTEYSFVCVHPCSSSSTRCWALAAPYSIGFER